MIRRETRLDLAMAGLLAGIVLVFFWGAALLQGVFFVQDVMVQNYPFRDFFSRSLKHLALPLWCPDINCGFPLFAEGQAGVLYPLNLLAYLLLPTYAGINWNIVLHLWWAGVGTYAFLRLLGCARSASLTGGLTYALSGFLVMRAMSMNYVDAASWMPFLFVAVELAVQRGRWLYLVLGGSAIGLQFLAGHPQATVYAVAAAVLYGLYRGWRQRAGWPFLAAVGLGLPLLGAGLAAVQLLPTAELVRVSARGQGVGLEEFQGMSLPPERLVTFLLPDFFGNSSTGSYWGGGEGFDIQLCGYVGVLPVLLALVALRRRQDQYAVFFGALCATGLLLALGRYTPVFEWLYHVPGLKFFRIPTRFLLWVAFGLAVLTGLGLEQILSRRQGRRLGWWAVCLLLAATASGMAWLNRPVLFGDDTWLARLGSHGAGLIQYKKGLQGDLVRCLVMLGAGAALLGVQGWGRRRRQAVAWACPLLVAADLYSFGHGFNGLVEKEVYLRTPATAAFVLQDVEPQPGRAPRTLSLVAEKNSPYDWHSGWALDLSSYRKYPQTLRMYTGSLYGVADVLPGWSPLHLGRHWEFVQGYPGFMDLAGVEYVLGYRPVQFPGLELALDQEIKVYRNLRRLPRAYLVRDWVVLPGSADRLRHLRQQGPQARGQVVLEDRVEPGFDRADSAGIGPARIAAYGPEEVVIELGADQGGFLVLSDTWYPGWRAWVDGLERPVLRANHVFRAVEVGEGARQVVFRYQPASFAVGAWVSGAFLAALLVFLLRFRHLRLQGLRSAPGEGSSWLGRATGLAVLAVLAYGVMARWPLWADALQRSRVLEVWGGPG